MEVVIKYPGDDALKGVPTPTEVISESESVKSGKATCEVITGISSVLSIEPTIFSLIKSYNPSLQDESVVYNQVARDSIETSVSMKLFKTIEEATAQHIFNSNLVDFSMAKFKNLNNFNPERLQNTAAKAYPRHDRPRGLEDISSVKYYQKLIQRKIDIPPIWILKKNNKYTLLDGAHRIVASYIENEKYIPAYIIVA